MRLISDIPHNRYKIQIFNYNCKFIVKIELDQYEQVYKINETDVNGVDEIKKMVTDSLLENALKRFVDMRADWSESFKSL